MTLFNRWTIYVQIKCTHSSQELLNRYIGECYQSVLYTKKVWNTSKKPIGNVAGTWALKQLYSFASYLILGSLHGMYVREHLLPHPFPWCNHSSNSVTSEQISMWLVWTATCLAVIFNLFLCWTWSDVCIPITQLTMPREKSMLVLRCRVWSCQHQDANF